jgi:hypothetical protein
MERLFIPLKKEQKKRAKGKGKVHPMTCHVGPERKQRYSSTLSLTLALDKDGC